MSEVRNGEQREHKYLYSEIFYDGQKLHKYFSSLRVRGTSLLTCSYIGELRSGQKKVRLEVRRVSLQREHRGKKNKRNIFLNRCALYGSTDVRRRTASEQKCGLVTLKLVIVGLQHVLGPRVVRL